MNLLGKPKYTLVLLKRLPLGNYEYVRKKSFNPKNDIIKIGNKSYPVKLAQVSYSHDNRHFLFADYDSGASLPFTEIETPMTAEELDTVIATHLVKVAVKAAGGANYGLLIIALGVCMGLFLGFLLGQNWTGIVGAVKGG